MEQVCRSPYASCASAPGSGAEDRATHHHSSADFAAQILTAYYFAHFLIILPIVLLGATVLTALAAFALAAFARQRLCR